MLLDNLKTVYFVGIGGIGMSAIARYLNGIGIQVFGYDKTETELTKTLCSEGISIHYQEAIDQIPNHVDLVIYTPAVPNTHKELMFFRENQFPIMKRAEVLGLISRSKKTIAVAGTHGKTTTSTMVTYLLHKCGVDCSAFLGGISKDFNSNFVNGKGDWVVVEADEFDRSFLHLNPDLAVITSMDPDHLDIYGDVENMRKTGFFAFAEKLKSGGILWIQKDWEHLLHGRTYGLEAGSYKATNVTVEDGYFVFDYESPEISIKGLKLSMPGKHNVENATAAISIALQAGANEAGIRAALQHFGGIKRRFEIIFRSENITYIDDYAHHPSELKAAINAARMLFPGKKITGIFQPHLFSRTRDFADGFAEALSLLDTIWLLDIYPARELPIEGVTSAMVLNKMDHPDKHLVEMEKIIEKIERSNLEILLTLGAGDISNLVEPIRQVLTNQNIESKTLL